MLEEYMKKVISFILSLTLLISVSSADGNYSDPYDEAQETMTYYSVDNKLPENVLKLDGLVGYENYIKNYDFVDETGLYKKASTELAVLGISSGVGQNLFGGSQELTNIQAITMLLRMLGMNKAIEDRVKSENPDIPYRKLGGYFHDAYLKEAFDKGILDTDEIKQREAVRREDMAFWLVNASQIQNDSAVNNIISDKNAISQGREDAILTVINNGLMRTSFDGKFNPKGNVLRRHFAIILDSALNRFPEILGLEKKLGLVVGIQKEDDETGRYTNIIIKNENGELEVLRHGVLTNGNRIGFPVLNGNLNYPFTIQKGMEVEFMLRDGKILLATVLYDSRVKNKIVDNALKDEGINVIQGKVLSNTIQKIDTDKDKLTQRRIRLESDDDSLVDFLETKDKISNIDSDLLVLGSNGFIPAAAVKKDDKLTAYVKGDKVLFLSYSIQPLKLVSGNLRHIEYPLPEVEGEKKEKNDEETKSNAFIRIFTDDNRLLDFPIDESTSYLVNDYNASLNDLKIGARVDVRVLRGKADYVKAYSYQAPSGYIPKEGKIEFLTVDQIYDNYFTVRENDEKVMVFPNETVIKKDGKTISINDLKSGDLLKVFYDDIYTEAPSRIVVEIKPSKVQEVLKAKVYDYSRATGFISLENISLLKDHKWNKESNYMKKYKLSDDSEIYYSNKKLEKDALNPKHGDTVYMVLRNNEVAKIIFSDGKERNYSSSLKQFDNVLNNINLNNGKAFVYGDDTIFIENGRLVTENNLEKGKALHVISNSYAGNDSAKLVSILNKQERLFDRVYFGYIDEVNNYSFTLNRFFVFDDMRFSQIAREPFSIELYDDSSIYVSDSKKYIDSQEFFHGDYYRKHFNEKGSKKKIKNSGLEHKRYYGIFYLDEENSLVGAKIRHKGFFEEDLLDDRLKSESKIAGEMTKIKEDLSFTRGYINDFRLDWKRIGISDSHNYFEFDQKWKANDEKTVLSVKDALIIKDGKAIEYEDLRLNDKVYAIRKDERVLFLYVED